jgi:hypothetical protein
MHYNNVAVSGAFTTTAVSSRMQANGSGSNGNKFNFNASRNWTGETSSNGNHTHTVSVNDNGNHTHTVTLTEQTVGESETRPKTIVGVYCVVAFGYVTNNGSVELEDVKNSLDALNNTMQALDNLVTVAVQPTQPSKPTTIWIKPV